MGRIKLTRIEKGMLMLAAVAAVAGVGGGYYAYAAGVGMALPVSLLLLRWQAAAVENLDNLPPGKAFNRFFGRALARSLLAVAVLGAAAAGGIAFLFGVLTGLVLEVLVYMGEAVLIICRKGGMK